MQINKIRLNVLLVLVLGTSAMAQPVINDPYSRYGIGEMYNDGLVQNRAMGGISIGLRRPYMINYMNPASYSAQDTNSFIFDIGLRTNYLGVSSSGGSISNTNTTFDHLGLSFYITKWWFGSIGLMPFSSINYQVDGISPYADSSTIYYKGTGGINRFYMGNAFTFLDNRLCLGFNLSYLFGTLSYTRNVINDLSGIEAYNFNEKKAQLGDIYLNFGAQYVYPISPKSEIIFGLVFDSKSKINTKYSDLYYNYDNTTSSVASGNDTIPTKNVSNLFYLPFTIGTGVSINLENRLITGIDFSTQHWSGVSLAWNDKLIDSYTAKFGLEYTPDPHSIRSYFAKVHYRCGIHYGRTNMQINNHNIYDRGLSVGIGLPYHNYSSTFNISYELGLLGTQQYGLIEETYGKIVFGLTLHDFWFYKPKFE